MPEDAYTNPDLIQALYLDPANEVLLAEYIMATGGAQAQAIQQAAAGGGVLDIQTLGGSGGIRGLCFAGETLVSFPRRQIPVGQIFRDGRELLGSGVVSFSQENEVAERKLVAVFRSFAKELLHVKFSGEPEVMRVKPQHRFWLAPERLYREIGEMLPGERVSGYTDRWVGARIESAELVKYPRGVEVFNLTVAEWHSYMATAPGGIPKAVSNNKPPADDNGLA